MELATQRIIYLVCTFLSSLFTIQTHSQDLFQTVDRRKLRFTYFICQVCSHLNPLLGIYYLTLITRSKGLEEEAQATMGHSDTIIFRPGLLAGVHLDMERFFILHFSSSFAHTLIHLPLRRKVTSLLSYVSNYVEIQVLEVSLIFFISPPCHCNSLVTYVYPIFLGFNI